MHIQMKSKKGLSAMIGYVLLITLAIAMSVFIYQWMESYVPKENLECNDGVAIFVHEYNTTRDWLNITLKNNGRYGLAGFYIYGSTNSSKGIATINLADVVIEESEPKIIYSKGGVRILKGGTTAGDQKNTFKPNEKIRFSFKISDLETDDKEIEFIQITPTMQKEYENRLMLATCGNQKIQETLN